MESSYAGKRCLVLPTEVLARSKFFPTNQNAPYSYWNFQAGDKEQFLELVNNCGEYRERFGENGVEVNSDYQQLIMYGFVIDGEGRLLLYRRAGAESYDEPRLLKKFSVGIGGHVEPSDEKDLELTFYREFGEEAELFLHKSGKTFSFTNQQGEVNISELMEYIQIRWVGLLKDNRDEAGAVHFAIVCKVEPKRSDLEVRIKVGPGQENAEYRYITPQDYDELCRSGEISVEGWTDIVFKHEISPDRDLQDAFLPTATVVPRK